MRRRQRPTHPPSLPSSDGAVPLSALAAGETGTIVGLAAGRRLRSRMATLGFTPGADVNVIQNFGRGPLIAMVRGSRIALGRGEATRIRVRKCGP